jgi:hypothetical protein
MIQLTECKLLVQGVASLHKARQKVLECIHRLREIFDEECNDVIPFEGI